MSLSTLRSRFVRNFFCVLAVPVVALLAAHFMLERLAQWAEVRPNTYLWRSDDQLLLLSPARFARPGKGRVMVFGASEAAEGFVDPIMARELPGASVENLAFDGATFNDLLVQLSYLETMYGERAIPSDIVIGISPRYVANILIPRTRLFRDAVNAYSPGVITGSIFPPRVERKSTLAAARSWLRFRAFQTERYTFAVKALAVDIAFLVRPDWVRRIRLRESLMKAKFQDRKRDSDEQIKKRLSGLPHWQKTYVWRASQPPNVLGREMQAVNDFALRHHVRLYYVNMPVLPANRTLFAPGAYEEYLSEVKKDLGSGQLIDLETLLPTAEFSDAVHATARGANHLSTATARYIRAYETSTQASR